MRSLLCLKCALTKVSSRSASADCGSRSSLGMFMDAAYSSMTVMRSIGRTSREVLVRKAPSHVLYERERIRTWNMGEKDKEMEGNGSRRVGLGDGSRRW